MLSTVSVQGEPESSYAPYVRDKQGTFYIFVSQLAEHSQNLLQTGKASVLFIQPEAQTQNLFARQRVVLNCSVTEVNRMDESFEKIMDDMQDLLGETVALLRSLPDFHLLAINPIKGKYIAGFGQAFKIETDKDQLVFVD